MYYNVFQDMFRLRIRTYKEEYSFGNIFIDEAKCFPLLEQLLVSIEKQIIDSNRELLAQLQRDIQSIIPKLARAYQNLRLETLAVIAFIELLDPIKYTMFSINESFQEFSSSNMVLFEKFYK